MPTFDNPRWCPLIGHRYGNWHGRKRIPVYDPRLSREIPIEYLVIQYRNCARCGYQAMKKRYE